MSWLASGQVARPTEEEEKEPPRPRRPPKTSQTPSEHPQSLPRALPDATHGIRAFLQMGTFFLQRLRFGYAFLLFLSIGVAMLDFTNVPPSVRQTDCYCDRRFCTRFLGDPPIPVIRSKCKTK